MKKAVIALLCAVSSFPLIAFDASFFSTVQYVYFSEKITAPYLDYPSSFKVANVQTTVTEHAMGGCFDFYGFDSDESSIGFFLGFGAFGSFASIATTVQPYTNELEDINGNGLLGRAGCLFRWLFNDNYFFAGLGMEYLSHIVSAVIPDAYLLPDPDTGEKYKNIYNAFFINTYNLCVTMELGVLLTLGAFKLRLGTVISYSVLCTIDKVFEKESRADFTMWMVRPFIGLRIL